MDEERQPLLQGNYPPPDPVQGDDHTIPNSLQEKHPAVPPPYGYNHPPQAHVPKMPEVVKFQPRPTPPPTGPPYVHPSDNYFILSILMTVVCLICGSPCALCCTIPAIVFAVNARDAESRSDHVSMQRNRTTAAVLNIIGFVFGLVAAIVAWYMFYRQYQMIQSNQDNNQNND